MKNKIMMFVVPMVLSANLSASNDVASLSDIKESVYHLILKNKVIEEKVNQQKNRIYSANDQVNSNKIGLDTTRSNIKMLNEKIAVLMNEIKELKSISTVKPEKALKVETEYDKKIKEFINSQNN
jgi:peptidoglycan hydrolase CwlO-like protein